MGLAPLGLLLVATALAAPALAASTAPGTMVVEGFMLSSGGGPATDGDYTATFTIYDKKSGGKALYTESVAKLVVKAGRFSVAMGATKPIDAAALSGLSGAWLGIKIGADPELPLGALHSVPYALRAQTAHSLDCDGCVSGKNIANGSLNATSVNFAYAGAADNIKGGDAKVARGLKCTGCVTVAMMKFDGAVDLGANPFSAGKVTIKGDVVSGGLVFGKQFIGDGSKLTGIKTPAGECSKAGEVVKGIDPNGSLKCVKSVDPSALPKDGLSNISNGQLSTQFNDPIAGGTKKPIPDNSPDGVLNSLIFPDIGIAQKLSVNVNIKNSDTQDLAVFLFPPNCPVLPNKPSTIIKNYPATPQIDGSKYPHYILHMKKQFNSGNKTELKTSFPKPTKEIAGDIHKDWLNKNIKGQWRLLIVDTAFLNNATDGELVDWNITIQTLSNKQVNVSGTAFVGGKLWGKYEGSGNPGGTVKVGAGLQIGTSAVKCAAGEEGTMRRIKGGGVQVCEGGAWVYLHRDMCPGPKVGGICLASVGSGNLDFRASSLHCASKHADLCTDSQVWTLDQRAMLWSTATWTNSFSDNDSGNWSELNNGTGDDHGWGSGWQGPCCYNLTAPRPADKVVKGVRLVYMHHNSSVYFRQAATYCNGMGADLCSKGQYQVLRENIQSSGMNKGWGYWASDHSDNDNTSASHRKGHGPTSNNTTLGQHYSFACCASHRKSIDECPAARIGGVCAPVVVDANSHNWSQSANACAAKNLELCSISETAVLRSKGKFKSSTRVWTESYSDCDGCPGTGTAAVPKGNSGPGYVSVGPIGDDHPNTTKAGYACCL
jgi:subtilisin-like proprotein convertase family protein